MLGDDAKSIYLDGQKAASWSYGNIGVGVDLAMKNCLAQARFYLFKLIEAFDRSQMFRLPRTRPSQSRLKKRFV